MQNLYNVYYKTECVWVVMVYSLKRKRCKCINVYKSCNSVVQSMKRGLKKDVKRAVGDSWWQECGLGSPQVGRSNYELIPE